MSGSGGPVNRRRIAGEKARSAEPAAPTAPATPPAAPKVPTARKAPVVRKKASTPAPDAPTTPAPPTPTVKVPATPPPPPRPATSGDDAPASRRRVPWLPVVSVLVLLAGLAVAVLGFLDFRAGDGALDSSERAAATAASEAAETIFSFRYDELDEHLAESKKLMTPKFAKEFESIAPALVEIAPQRQVVVEAVSRNAAALPCGDECSDRKARILVFVDQARLVTGSEEPTVFGNRITVSMVQRDGTWLVDDIRAL